ncbi:hypothetical protein D9M68_426020 [compost metagenome]
MSCGLGRMMQPLPLVHKPAMARISELLPPPLAPTISSPSPGSADTVRSRTSVRSRLGVRSVTCSSDRRESCTASIVGAGPAALAGVAASVPAKVSSRSSPATKRARSSKLSTITVSAFSTAANAPAAWIARPTSISPDSTCEATMALGSRMVRKP